MEPSTSQCHSVPWCNFVFRGWVVSQCVLYKELYHPFVPVLIATAGLEVFQSRLTRRPDISTLISCRKEVCGGVPEVVTFEQPELVPRKSDEDETRLCTWCTKHRINDDKPLEFHLYLVRLLHPHPGFGGKVHQSALAEI